MSKYIRTRDMLFNGMVRCYTCDEVHPFAYMQGGHFVPKGRGSVVYFVFDNIHAQCPKCNKHLGGNVHIYRERMVAEHGEERVLEIEDLPDAELRKEPRDRFKLTIEWLEELEREIARRMQALYQSRGY